MKKKKMLVVAGPTATGKTSLALALAQKFGGELVSADSRQLYKDADIGTGKDLPSGAERQYWKGVPFYTVDGTRVWGYGLVSPADEYSVGQYLKDLMPVFEYIYQRHKLPIIVGGTGLYIKAVVDGIASAEVPKDINLRKKLENFSPEELLEILTILEPARANLLNSSDSKNPRRLIRALEILKSKSRLPVIEPRYNTLFIGLSVPENYENIIRSRVEARIQKGMEGEVKKLLDMGASWDSQVLSGTGYGPWREYMEGSIDKSELVERWVQEETAYAKRQMTWFKKDNRIHWYSMPSDKNNIEKLVEKWYSSD